MWCTVYVLYFEGKRRPDHEVRNGPMYGWLRMRSKTPGARAPFPQAFMLHGPEAFDDTCVYQLDHCSLRAIDGGGIRLVGVESKHTIAPGAHQSWWVIPGKPQ